MTTIADLNKARFNRLQSQDCEKNEEKRFGNNISYKANKKNNEIFKIFKDLEGKGEAVINDLNTLFGIKKLSLVSYNNILALKAPYNEAFIRQCKEKFQGLFFSKAKCWVFLPSVKIELEKTIQNFFNLKNQSNLNTFTNVNKSNQNIASSLSTNSAPCANGEVNHSIHNNFTNTVKGGDKYSVLNKLDCCVLSINTTIQAKDWFQNNNSLFVAIKNTVFIKLNADHIFTKYALNYKGCYIADIGVWAINIKYINNVKEILNQMGLSNIDTQ